VPGADRSRCQSSNNRFFRHAGDFIYGLRHIGEQPFNLTSYEISVLSDLGPLKAEDSNVEGLHEGCLPFILMQSANVVDHLRFLNLKLPDAEGPIRVFLAAQQSPFI
jgi:hypothetical protein